MNIRKSKIITIAIVLLTFVVSACLYPQMPEKMATHWNARGAVDGYMSKSLAVFLMPVIIAVIAALFIFIPKIDPLKVNFERFRKYYDGFVILFCAFMLCLQYFMLLWNIGIRISLNILLPVSLGLLFFYIGILCKHAKRNWFVGIRTPWTLTSETVWNKTHKIGGKLFKVAGVIIVVGSLFPGYLLCFILIPVFLIAVFTLIYSYLEYQKENP